MLPVLAVPPEGECEQTAHLDFSDGRTLSVRLVFDDPWPTLHVQYGEPVSEEIESGAIERAPRALPNAGFSWFRWDAMPFRTPAWIGPRFWSGLVAVGMVAVLLFVQTRETTLSAAVLVSRAEEWSERPRAVWCCTARLIWSKGQRVQRGSHTGVWKCGAKRIPE